VSPIVATTTVRGPVRSMSPSCSSRRMASRTGVGLTESRSASPRSVIFSPGRSSPDPMASRTARYERSASVSLVSVLKVSRDIRPR
jgi:hypothetical protein